MGASMSSQRISRGFHRLGFFLALGVLVAGALVMAFLVSDGINRQAEQRNRLIAFNCAKEKLAERAQQPPLKPWELGWTKRPDGNWELPEGWRKAPDSEQWYYKNGYRNLQELGCSDKEDWQLKTEMVNAVPPTAHQAFDWPSLLVTLAMFALIPALAVYGLLRAIGWVIGGFAVS